MGMGGEEEGARVDQAGRGAHAGTASGPAPPQTAATGQPDGTERTAPLAEAPAGEEADDDSDSDASGSSDGEASEGDGAQEEGGGYDEHGSDAEGLLSFDVLQFCRGAMFASGPEAAEAAEAACNPNALARYGVRLKKRTEGAGGAGQARGDPGR